MKLKMKSRTFDRLCVSAVILFFVGSLLFASYFEHHYTSKLMVCDVDGTSVTCYDLNGEKWSFYGDGYEVGDFIKVKMYDNGTFDYVYDDVIEGVV